MRLLMIVLAVTALVLASSQTRSASADDFLYANTKADRSGMPYRYFVPPGYDSTKSYPLILFLHGSGERGSDNERQLANHANGAMYLLDDANLAQQPVFMIAPQCPSKQSWNGAVLDQAIATIEQVSADYNIDLDRIYVTGLSMGGMGSWNAVTERPRMFTAAVPMSGHANTSLAPTVRQVPMWFFHAANDGTRPPDSAGASDQLVAALRAAGARVIYTRYATGGHSIWSHAYRTPMLFHWLASQRRGHDDESVPPSVHIMQSTEQFSLFTGASNIALGGLADNGSDAIDSVTWHMHWNDTGNAAGTTNWTTGSIPLSQGSNLIRVTATGPSYYAPYGGHTTFNDTIRVVRAEGVIFADGFEPF